MTPIAYAEALVRERYTLSIDKSPNDHWVYWRFKRIQVKGNKHEPRTRLDRGKAFFRLLTGVKVVTDHVLGGVAHYVPTEFFEAYRTDLLCAGLNPDAELWQVNREDLHWVVIRPKLFAVASVSARLANHFSLPNKAEANRTAGVIKARQTRYQNLARRKFQQAHGFTAAEEKLADQQTAAFVTLSAGGEGRGEVA